MTSEQRQPITTFRFVADPGHGWLIVSADQLARAGLTERDITPFSYRSRDGKIALEEDCDLPTFLTAWEARVGPVRFDEWTVETTPIRGWLSFGKKGMAA